MSKASESKTTQTLREILIPLSQYRDETTKDYITPTEAEAAIKAWAKELVGVPNDYDSNNELTDYQHELITKIDNT